MRSVGAVQIERGVGVRASQNVETHTFVILALEAKRRAIGGAKSLRGDDLQRAGHLIVDRL